MKKLKLTRRKALTFLGAAGGAATLYALNPFKNGLGANPEFDLTKTELTDYFRQSKSTQPTLLKTSDFSKPQCNLMTTTSEGPYYFGVNNMRRDVTEDREGMPFQLGFRVVDKNCNPIENALVDIWQCDAEGYYAGFPNKNPNDSMARIVWGLLTASSPKPVESENFLRGIQATNADGIAEFKTIYPGWYGARTLHIHAKIYVNEDSEATSEFYLDDAVTDSVFSTYAPYNTRAERPRRNSDDSMYTPDRHLDLAVTADGYRGLVTVGVDT